MSKKVLADYALLLVAMVWGTTFVVVKNALADMQPYTFLVFRFTIAFAVMAVLFHRRLLRGLDRRKVLPAAVIGLVLFSAYALQTIGLKYTTAANSAFVTGLAVVFVPLVGTLWGQKRPDTLTWVGIASAVIGLGLLTLTAGLQLNRGDFLTLLCAICTAFHIVLIGQYAPRFDATVLSTLQIGVVALASIAAAGMSEPLPTGLSHNVWIALAVTAIPATVFAFLVQSVAQKYTTATRTVLIFTMEPVFASLFSYWLLDEVLTLRQLTGCALMIVGAIASEAGDAIRQLFHMENSTILEENASPHPSNSSGERAARK